MSFPSHLDTGMLAIPGVDGEQIRCRPFFIVDQHSVPRPRPQAPYYVVSCGEIVNIFPGYAIDSVVDLRLKGAATRTFSTLRQAALVAGSFCAKHHPTREHASSLLYRCPLTTAMKDFPIFLHSNQGSVLDEGVSFTPLSDDLFLSPTLCSSHNTSDFDRLADTVPPVQESSDSEEDIQIIRHFVNLLTPPLQDADRAVDADDMVEAIDPTLVRVDDAGRNAQANAPAVAEAPDYYLIRLEPDRSYLFRDLRAARRVLEDWNTTEGSCGDFIVSNGVFRSPDNLLRDCTIPEHDYYYAIRGHDAHGVFSNARRAQAFYEEQCLLSPLSSMMITSDYILAGEWAFEISENSDGEEVDD